MYRTSVTCFIKLNLKTKIIPVAISPSQEGWAQLQEQPEKWLWQQGQEGHKWQLTDIIPLGMPVKLIAQKQFAWTAALVLLRGLCLGEGCLWVFLVAFAALSSVVAGPYCAFRGQPHWTCCPTKQTSFEALRWRPDNIFPCSDWKVVAKQTLLIYYICYLPALRTACCSAHATWGQMVSGLGLLVRDFDNRID